MQFFYVFLMGMDTLLYHCVSHSVLQILLITNLKAECIETYLSRCTTILNNWRITHCLSYLNSDLFIVPTWHSSENTNTSNFINIIQRHKSDLAFKLYKYLAFFGIYYYLWYKCYFFTDSLIYPQVRQHECLMEILLTSTCTIHLPKL